MDIINNEKEYNKQFEDNFLFKKKLKSALEKAHDIRKFEIELYWKRATYFWVFIAAVFTGYFTLLKSDQLIESDYFFILHCLGLVFSFAFYLVNRASKYWQVNWEKHVDMLEDKITGPLYKTTFNTNEYKLSKILGPLNISPTRINEILSLYIFFIWIFLFLKFISTKINWKECFPELNIFILMVSTLFALWGMYKFSKSDSERECKSSPNNTFTKRKKPLT